MEMENKCIGHYIYLRPFNCDRMPERRVTIKVDYNKTLTCLMCDRCYHDNLKSVVNIISSEEYKEEVMYA